MGPKTVQLSLLLVLAMMLCHGATAQSGCTSALLGLSPCMNYVSGSSPAPSPSCCSQLASVVQSQPQCLCTLLNGGSSSLGITVNQTLALALPGACKVQTPPVSQCNAANGPATSPATAPLNSPPADSSDAKPETPVTPSTKPETPATPSNPSIPAGSGSKTVPTATGTSDATSVRTQLHLSILIIFSALWASNFITY